MADFIVYATVLGSIVFFGGAAILAMAWSFRNGQFENFHKSSRSIFDADEPVGRVTDRFPDAPRSHGTKNSSSEASHRS